MLTISKVNKVSQFDAYPMARVSKLPDQVGTAHVYLFNQGLLANFLELDEWRYSNW